MTPVRTALQAGSLAGLLLFGGCAGFAPSVAPSVTPSPAQAERAYVDNIELAGRLSVRYQGRDKEEGLHGNFSWTQTTAQTTVNLATPLGQTVAVIEASPDGARMLQPGHPPRTAPDVDTLTSQALGWPLPVSGLRSWLQGFGTDGQGRRFVASPEHDEFITSDGWRLRYAGWQDDQPGIPKRIDLARNTVQAGEVSLRIVIDSWQPR
ncbi:outer membrane lipoprotein LolB [Oxalobacteraceae bacterium OM1]|nr:outer membrane lipoprotein LolB [Oxalobacteraceae bacterium OM1]